MQQLVCQSERKQGSKKEEELCQNLLKNMPFLNRPFWTISGLPLAAAAKPRRAMARFGRSAIHAHGGVDVFERRVGDLQLRLLSEPIPKTGSAAAERKAVGAFGLQRAPVPF
jgi:hypothetical protein